MKLNPWFVGSAFLGGLLAGAGMWIFFGTGASWPATVFIFSAGAGGAFATHTWIKKYESVLESRASNSTGTTWTVTMNGIRVASINDAQYARFQLASLRDGRNYVGQLVDIFRLCIRALNSTVIAVPVLFFWGVLATALVEPELLISVPGLVAKATPLDVFAFAKTVALFLGFISYAVLVFASIFFENRFPNRFLADTGRRVRFHCGIAVDGQFVMWQDIADPTADLIVSGA